LKKLLYIARYRTLAVLLLLLLALAPALAQNVVYQGQTSTLTVQQEPGDTYDWEIYDNASVNFATVPGNCPVTSAIFVGGNIGVSVQVKWIKPGIYFFKVNARNITGCTNNIKIGMMEVKESLPTAIISVPDPICIGETASLEVTLTGTGPWEISYTNGISTWTVKGISTNTHILQVTPTLPGSNYWITVVKDAYGTNVVPSDKVWLEVKPKPMIVPIYQYEP
jgi:hypothetical protein